MKEVGAHSCNFLSKYGNNGLLGIFFFCCWGQDIKIASVLSGSIYDIILVGNYETLAFVFVKAHSPLTN